MDYLCELPNDAARRKALTSLPPDLNSTYERILERVNASNTEVQKLVQSSLRWIICSRRPLSIKALCEATSINEEDIQLDREAVADEDEILHWCSSLVRKSASGFGLELAHFTVKEFLEAIDRKSKLAAYRIKPEDEHLEMGKICLTYLCLQDFEAGSASSKEDFVHLEETYPFRSYAVTCWYTHARNHFNDSTIFLLAQKLFEPSKPNIFISWAQGFVIHELGAHELGADDEELFDIPTSSSAVSSPLHYAAMLALPELCDWLLQQGCDVNQSSAFGRPLHCALLGKMAPLGCRMDPFDTGLDPLWPSESIEKVVMLFIKAGADPHSRYRCTEDSTYRSPLLIAVMTLSNPCSKLLLQAGAIFDGECIEWVSFLRDENRLELIERVNEENLRDEDRGEFLELALVCKGSELDKLLRTKRLQSEDTQGSLADFQASLRTAVELGQERVVKSLIQDHTLSPNAGDENKSTVLHVAAEKGCIGIIEILLDSGADIHHVDHKGQTALHRAVEAKDSCCISLLLARGSNAAHADYEGLTIWHLAALRNNLEALEILKEEAAETLPCISRDMTEGRTLLLCAAQAGSKEAIDIVMKLNGNLTDKDDSGATLLHYAAKAGNLDAFRFLLSQGMESNALANDGSSLLHFAVAHGREEIVDLLIENGADPCVQRKDGMTPLHLLSVATSAIPQEEWEWEEREWKDMLEMLLANGADLAIKDRMGNSSFKLLLDALGKEGLEEPGISARGRKLKILSSMMCIALGHITDPRILDEKFEGLHPLSLAVQIADEDLTAKLLEHPVNVDARNEDKFHHTALELACIFGCRRNLFKAMLERSTKLTDKHQSEFGLIHLASDTNSSASTDIVSTLLEAGMDPNMRGRGARTSLMLAAEAGKVEIAKVLLRHGADVLATSVDGWNAVHFAASAGREMILQLLKETKIEWTGRVRCLALERDFREASILHIAAANGRESTVEYILNNDLLIDVNVVMEHQVTALLLAAAHGHTRTVSALLSKGADANMADSDLGCSPLIVSSQNGHEEVVRILLAHGCNPRTPNFAGLTAELLALEKGHKLIAKLLREHILKQGTNS